MLRGLVADDGSATSIERGMIAVVTIGAPQVIMPPKTQFSSQFD